MAAWQNAEAAEQNKAKGGRWLLTRVGGAAILEKLTTNTQRGMIAAIVVVARFERMARHAVLEPKPPIARVELRGGGWRTEERLVFVRWYNYLRRLRRVWLTTASRQLAGQIEECWRGSIDGSQVVGGPGMVNVNGSGQFACQLGRTWESVRSGSLVGAMHLSERLTGKLVGDTSPCRSPTNLGLVWVSLT
jgi:hypothetical protein